MMSSVLRANRTLFLVIFIVCLLVSSNVVAGFGGKNKKNKKNQNKQANNNNNNQQNDDGSSSSPAENDKCQVLNSAGEDVTSNVYDSSTKLVDCTGEKICQGFQANYCANIRCDGKFACDGAIFRNVTGNVDCLGENKACWNAQIHAVAGKDREDKESVTNVNCIGKDACDVAFLTNIHNLNCDGYESCRKIRAHATNIKCNNGGTTSNTKGCSESATFVYSGCLVCGNNHGCGHAINQCRWRVQGRDEKITENYWIESNWENWNSREQWTKCKENTIHEGDKDMCLNEWKDEFETEALEDNLKNSAGQEGSEGGTRTRSLLRKQ